MKPKTKIGTVKSKISPHDHLHLQKVSKSLHVKYTLLFFTLPCHPPGASVLLPILHSCSHFFYCYEKLSWDTKRNETFLDLQKPNSNGKVRENISTTCDLCKTGIVPLPLPPSSVYPLQLQSPYHCVFPKHTSVSHAVLSHKPLGT